MKKKLVSCKNNEEKTKSFIVQYAKTGEPISVSFRELLPHINKSDRFTHQIHTYPAKLLAQIPYFFCNNSYFSSEGDIILDPFCGSGTVLLEANLAGRNAIGADANPLARLIASVKTQKLNEKKLLEFLRFIVDNLKYYNKHERPQGINVDFWFSPNVQEQLAKLKGTIEILPEGAYKNFFKVCFSNCIKKVSYADPRIAVPVKLNPKRYPEKSKRFDQVQKRLQDLESDDILEKFSLISLENINRIKSLDFIQKNIKTRLISSDARHLTTHVGSNSLLLNESVDMVLTSPPYAGAQKYVRSSSLSLGWLGFLNEKHSIRSYDSKNIGRENYNNLDIQSFITGIEEADILIEEISKINRLRAFIVANYLREMKDAIKESARVLKKNGFFIMIIGNNVVCKREFNTQDFLCQFVESLGFTVEFKLIDDIKSYGLMTKRNNTLYFYRFYIV